MPKFLDKTLVLKIHTRQIERFGGTNEIRDEGLLESALAQPQSGFANELFHPTIYEQAAAYLYHLAMNHPFIDGNKRTAFAVMDTFLRVNDHTLTLSDAYAYDMVLRVANGLLSKADLAIYLRSCIVSPGL